MFGSPQGFFSAFCDVAKSGDHPENNLAKFGYIIDIKVGENKFKKKKKPESFYIPG